MPTNLDFDSTRKFRDFILGKTLEVPNGPQTFTSTSYDLQSLSDAPNLNPGTVDDAVPNELIQTQNSNVFKPLTFSVTDSMDVLPRRANLSLYPYFVSGDYTLVGIMGSSTYNTESELFKFAASNIQNNPEGPVLSRISQNIYTATYGQLNVLDALNGNTAMISNLVTGKASLIEPENKITVSNKLPGLAVDFLQTVAGVELPFTTIPGDYLTNPRNPVNYKPASSSEIGKLSQDITGALGSLIGIPRRQSITRKPSDLFIDYMGSGSKQVLFDLLSYSTYAPNYTTTARSENTSKVFNFIDRTSQGIKNLIGVEAPPGVAYIGDDRGENVKFAMGDFNDIPIKSPFYLSLMFDEVQTTLFQRDKNIGDGGSVGTNLTWYSVSSKNKLGVNNQYTSDDMSSFMGTLSTAYGFRDNSILGKTQDILNTLPNNGSESRSHVANVIDQTSRVFKEGDMVYSRGSAVKYVNKFSGEESGVEFCRVWTKDRPYYRHADLFPTTGDTKSKTYEPGTTPYRRTNIRKMDASVLSTPWNLNIAPMSDGNKSFNGSTNISPGGQPDRDGKTFYAKKYMISIENLAWKASNSPGFSVIDLPFSERGPNGGRVMWFPPYDIKVSEQGNAKWEENLFLGRPEPIYTYQNGDRSGQLSFKIVVDHPSILNLLVRDHFKGMSDEESDNYINAFFAGCQDIDFYSLIRNYSSLSPDDAKLIKQYLNEGGSPIVIDKYKSVIDNVTQNAPTNTTTTNPTVTQVDLKATLNFINNKPYKGNQDYISNTDYSTEFSEIGSSSFQDTTLKTLTSTLNKMLTSGVTENKADLTILYNTPNPLINNPSVPALVNQITTGLTTDFNILNTSHSDYLSKLAALKVDISGGTVGDVTITINSSASALGDGSKNSYLSIRRSHSVLKDIINKLSNGVTPVDKWTSNPIGAVNGSDSININVAYTYNELGYNGITGVLTINTISNGENVKGIIGDCHNSNFKDNILKINAPVSFGCRASNVSFSYQRIDKQNTSNGSTNNTNQTNTANLKSSIVPDGKITVQSKVKKPPIDVMKRIIMKTLSEEYYFKKLEESSPIAFKSLREKLRYFHPAFHSTTPEGLNSRLTFLQQCLRPGDTIPITGLVDDRDLGARNTTFGPPPFCILRIGDFYNSKIIIRNINITYDESIWDLNPEGIGVQPMIANVTLQINFIGGHGLEKPVERLQNALSSNFYANTEMYDERSITTNSTMGGTETSQFTKVFLESLQNNSPKEVITPNNSDSGNKTIQGVYIGNTTKTDGFVDYTSLIGDISTNTQNYLNGYSSMYNNLLQTYGPKITDLFISQKYRTISGYNINTTSGSTSQSMSLFGLYPPTKDKSILFRGLKSAMVTTLMSYPSILTMFNFDRYIPQNKVIMVNQNIVNYLYGFIQTKIDSLNDDKSCDDFEIKRNTLIESLDKLNFIVKYGVDVQVNGTTGNQLSFGLPFTPDSLYGQYSSCVDYININTPTLYSYLDESIDYTLPIISNDQFDEIMSNIMGPSEVIDLLSIINKIIPNLDNKTTNKLTTNLTNFLVSTPPVTFTFTKFTPLTTNTVSFETSSDDPITDTNILEEAKILFSSSNPLTNNTKTLNYYKK